MKVVISFLPLAFLNFFFLLQYGDTPLHTSARYGHAGVMRILISAQCHVSDQNKVSNSHVYLCFFIMLIKNLMVKALSDNIFPCIYRTSLDSGKN